MKRIIISLLSLVLISSFAFAEDFEEIDLLRCICLYNKEYNKLHRPKHINKIKLNEVEENMHRCLITYSNKFGKFSWSKCGGIK